MQSRWSTPYAYRHSAKGRETAGPAGRSTRRPKTPAAAPQPHAGFLDAELAIDVLRPIAHELHRHETRDEMTADEFALAIHRRLQALQRREDADEVLLWLRERAAVIVEFGEGSGRLGFFHLHIQEYLAALHIEREGLLTELAGLFEREWWHEVARLVVSIGGKRTFAELLGHLLTDRHLLDVKLHDALRALFVDAREIDVGPVRTRLDAAELPGEEVLLALIRLVQGTRDQQLAESARRLAARAGGSVRIAGEHLAATAAMVADPAGGACVAVLAHSADAPHARELAERLRRLGVAVWPGSGDPPVFEAIDRQRLGKEVAAAALVFGAQAWWTDGAMSARLAMLGAKGPRLVGVRPPGVLSPAAELPIEIDVDLSAGWDDVRLDTLRRLLVPGPTGPVEGQAFVEPRIGMRLVWVPGSVFTMGSNKLGGRSSPQHPVGVSPFGVGETPVTNRQYEVFLREAGHRRPPLWSHPDHSDPEQPVVAVSWDDAMAFCTWLSAESGLKVTLPSEAQWEFAARGTDGRMYPWGNEPPDASRACFAQGKPAWVGSSPKGQGPFGTQDQAGNVWEWCLDVWNVRAYAARGRRKDVFVDPVVDKGDKNNRALRGGSWREVDDEAAEWLAAACRYWFLHDDGAVVDHIGFRVVVAASRRIRA